MVEHSPSSLLLVGRLVLPDSSICKQVAEGGMKKDRGKAVQSLGVGEQMADRNLETRLEEVREGAIEWKVTGILSGHENFTKESVVYSWSK